MLDAIKRFFDTHIIAAAGNQSAPLPEQALQLATAALMFEVSRMDFAVQPEEMDAMAGLLQERFGLAAEDVQELLGLARRESQQASSYHEFTSLIHKHFSYEQKVRLIEMMWLVAYVDGSINRYEEHLIRKVAELLYVKHVDFVAARHRAGR